MVLCLSRLSPRLPPAIPPAPRHFSFALCLITLLAIWLEYVPVGTNPSCYALTYCSFVYLPDRSHMRCITFAMRWHSAALRGSISIPAVSCDSKACEALFLAFSEKVIPESLKSVLICVSCIQYNYVCAYRWRSRHHLAPQ